MTIDNLLFDLGGVLLNLDVAGAAARFDALGGRPFAEQWNLRQQAPYFEAYECGATDTAQFLRDLRAGLEVPQASDAQLIDAWNAMLGDLPAARLDHLVALRSHFRLFLLSNTNALHMQHVTSRLPKGSSLAAYFDTLYLSYRMGCRKPMPVAFNYVLQDSGLRAERTLFIDDVSDNVEAARRCGLQGRVHPHGGDLEKTVPMPTGPSNSQP